jgi:hypothetical protein
LQSGNYSSHLLVSFLLHSRMNELQNDNFAGETKES